MRTARSVHRCPDDRGQATFLLLACIAFIAVVGGGRGRARCPRRRHPAGADGRRRRGARRHDRRAPRCGALRRGERRPADQLPRGRRRGGRGGRGGWRAGSSASDRWALSRPATPSDPNRRRVFSTLPGVDDGATSPSQGGATRSGTKPRAGAPVDQRTEEQATAPSAPPTTAGSGDTSMGTGTATGTARARARASQLQPARPPARRPLVAMAATVAEGAVRVPARRRPSSASHSPARRPIRWMRARHRSARVTATTLHPSSRVRTPRTHLQRPQRHRIELRPPQRRSPPRPPRPRRPTTRAARRSRAPRRTSTTCRPAAADHWAASVRDRRQQSPPTGMPRRPPKHGSLPVSPASLHR